MFLLQPGDVHVWMAYFEEIDDPLTLRAYDALMTAEERAQAARFHFAVDRHRYRVTRALLRNTLSRYAPVEASAWRFTTSAYGRPHVDPLHGDACELSFNISHTRGLIVLAVTRQVALGVDVENIAHRDAPLDVADRYFSAAETAALAGLDPALRSRRFYGYWTLKESYVKARGMGLSLPLDGFTFHYLSETAVTLTLDDVMDDDAQRWEFWQWQPDPDHLVALCVERSSEVSTNVILQPPLPARRHEGHQFTRTPTVPLTAWTPLLKPFS